MGERYRLLNAQGVLDERTRRLWAAAEARSAGYGGLAAVVRATGISESTVLRGLADLDSEQRPAPGNVRGILVVRRSLSASRGWRRISRRSWTRYEG